MAKTKEQLDAIIRKYHVTIASGGRIHVIAPKGASNAEVASVIRPNKQALISRIREVEAERRAGDARVAAIPMLEEMRDYGRAHMQWRADRERAWESGEGRWPTEPAKPEGDTTEAEAYLALEDMSRASNDRKAGAGRRGIEAVRSGEKSPSQALNDAETEWTAAINELIWA